MFRFARSLYPVTRYCSRSALKLPTSSNIFSRVFSSASKKQKVVAVLYEGGKAAKEPRLLGCVENGLGIGSWLKEQGHEYHVTSDKGESLDEMLRDTDVLITTPFHPAYVTKERLNNSNLKIVVTAGVGSDHIDLATAIDKGVSVVEVTGSNVVSVAEHVVMMVRAPYCLKCSHQLK